MLSQGLRRKKILSNDHIELIVVIDLLNPWPKFIAKRHDDVIFHALSRRMF